MAAHEAHVTVPTQQEPPYSDEPSSTDAGETNTEGFPAPPLSATAGTDAGAQSTDLKIRHLTLTSVSLALASFAIGIVLTVLIAVSENHGAYTAYGFRALAVWLILTVCVYFRLPRSFAFCTHPALFQPDLLADLGSMPLCSGRSSSPPLSQR